MQNSPRRGKSTFQISARATSQYSFTHLKERLILFTRTKTVAVKASHDDRIAVCCGMHPVSMSLVPEWDGKSGFFPPLQYLLDYNVYGNVNHLSKFASVTGITVTKPFFVS